MFNLESRPSVSFERLAMELDGEPYGEFHDEFAERFNDSERFTIVVSRSGMPTAWQATRLPDDDEVQAHHANFAELTAMRYTASCQCDDSDGIPFYPILIQL